MSDPLAKARSLVEGGALRRAAEELSGLADEIRLSPPGVLLVGRIAEAFRVRVVARTAYLRARRAPGTRRPALLGLASVALDTHRPLRADHYLEELLIDAGELRLEALALQVRVKAELGRFNAATRSLAECRELAGESDVRPKIAQVQLLRFQDRRHEAMQVSSEAIEADPEDVDLRLGYADLCWLNGDIPGAIEALRFAIRKRPEDYRLRVAIGDGHAALQSWPAAAGAYRRALAITTDADDAARVRLALAMALERRGAREEAESQYRHCLEMPAADHELAAYRLEVMRGSEPDAAPPAQHVIHRCRPCVQVRDGSAVAAVSSLLAAWGKNVLPTRLRKSLGHEAPPHRVAHLLREEGLSVCAFRCEYDSLRALAEAGVPALLVTERRELRHYLVVAGFDEIDGALLTRDPERPEWVSIDRFELERLCAPEGWRAIVAWLPAEESRLKDIRLDWADAHESVLSAESTFESDPEDDEALEVLESAAQQGLLGPFGMRQLADACTRRGEWERAFSVLEQAGSEHPGDSGLERRIVQVLAAFGEHSTAVDVATQLLGFRPHAGDLLYLRARSRYELGEIEAAYQDLTRSIRLGPDCAERFGLLARMSHELGDPDTALQWYEVAIDVDPGYVWAQTQRGDLLLERNQLDEARACYEAAVAANPSAPAAQVRLGRLLAERYGEPEAAESCFREAIRESYEDAWAWLELGRLQVRQGQWDAARESFVSALDRDPQCYGALAGLGQLHHEVFDEPEMAEVYYRRAIEYDEQDPWVFAQLGHLLQSKLKRSGESVPLYRKALDLDPSMGWVAARLGELYETTFERFDLAEQYYRHALEQSPEDAWGWMRLGRIAETVHGEVEAADACYSRAAELEPDRPWAMAERARLAVETGQPARAISLYERLLDAVPGDRWILFRLSQLFVEVGHIAQAVRYLEMLAEVDPSSPAAHRNLALAYERVGRHGDAVPTWDRYLDLVGESDAEVPDLEKVEAHVDSLRRPNRKNWWRLGRTTNTKSRTKKQRGGKRRSREEEMGG
ncbi:MAG: tetratricopeptide repeat protein [Planctomycetota bacterium]